MAAYRELDALRAQLADLQDLLSLFTADDWSRPTRCPPMTVRELTVHVAAVLPVWQSLVESEPAEKATSDRLEWWRYDAEAQAPKIVERAQRMAGEKSDDDLVPYVRDGASALLVAFEATPPDKIVQRGSVALPAADLACVGAVEVGIHTMDLGHATFNGERITKQAAELVCEVLEGLLGEPVPAKMGWDSRTLILTLSGRRPIGGNEHWNLGALAAKLPALR